MDSAVLAATLTDLGSLEECQAYVERAPHLVVKYIKAKEWQHRAAKQLEAMVAEHQAATERLEALVEQLKHGESVQ